MVIVMQAGATAAQIAAVVARVEQDGLKTQVVRGTERNIVCALGDDRLVDKRAYAVLDGVETATPILKPFKLAWEDFSLPVPLSQAVSRSWAGELAPLM